MRALRAHRRRRQQRRRRGSLRHAARTNRRARSTRSGSCTSPPRCESRALRCRTSRRRAAASSSSARESRASPRRATARTRWRKPRFAPRAIQLRRELRPLGSRRHVRRPGRRRHRVPFAASASSARKRISARQSRRTASQRAILRGIERRSAASMRCPWQTAGTVLGEWFRHARRRGDRQPLTPKPHRHLSEAGGASRRAHARKLPPNPRSSFEAALEPVRAANGTRETFAESFVRSVLVPGETIELNDAAMRWAGMPNKNERAALHEVLDALAAAGFLQTEDEDRGKSYARR